MAENKRGRSKYALKMTKRKKLSGSRGYTTFKGKHLPLPLPLLQDADVQEEG